MTMPMTPERRAEIAARAAATTPGDWVADRDGSAEVLAKQPTGVYLLVADATTRANAAFIASARQDVADLLSALELAELARAKAEAELEEVLRRHVSGSAT